MNEILENPVPHLLNDFVFKKLQELGIINTLGVRNLLIKKMFQEYRSNKMSAGEAIEKIQEKYPYIQFESVRKIIYDKTFIGL